MKREDKMKNRTWSQIGLYFLLAAGIVTGVICLAGVLYLSSYGLYQTHGKKEFQEKFLEDAVESHLYYMCYDQTNYPTLQKIEEQINRETRLYGITYTITRFPSDENPAKSADAAGLVCFDNRKGETEENAFVYSASFERTRQLGEQVQEDAYLMKLYLPVDGAGSVFGNLLSLAETLYEVKGLLLPIGFICLLLVLLCFIKILCNAGHLSGSVEPVGGVLSDIPFDLLTGGFCLGGMVFLYLVYCMVLVYQNWLWRGMVLSLGTAFMAIWCTFWFQEAALRLKLGKWWRNTLIYKVFSFGKRIVRGSFRRVGAVLEVLPAIWAVVLSICVVCLSEFFVMAVFWSRSSLVLLLWILEKMVIVPILLYCAWAFTRLQNRSRQMADGRMEENPDNNGFLYCFLDMGNHLNRIHEGMLREVEEKMRSERLKTELITNVSHDIKTPLTSIINYADLLGNVALDGESDEIQKKQLAEYSEVLLRQAARLKKLLEDLIDASRAATGSLEVHLEPMDLGVLVTQIIGEYETKLSDKQLHLRLAGADAELRVLADGRYLFRVFDNLFNNICKYAQENSRVYLEVKRDGKDAVIIFRNMSKYELDISAQDLAERFVRGDASRHQEGSGLGLSIAMSLMELQKGTMQIDTDGDLFKVILTLQIAETEKT